MAQQKNKLCTTLASNKAPQVYITEMFGSFMNELWFLAQTLKLSASKASVTVSLKVLQ
jgi:hypothetical protein